MSAANRAPASRQMIQCGKLGLFDPEHGFPDPLEWHGLVSLLAGTDDPGDPTRQNWEATAWSALGTGERWRGDELQRVELLVAKVSRAGAVDWLKRIGETPDKLHPCAWAWLGDEWQGRGIVGRRQDRIRQIIGQIQRIDPSLSPDAMPGTRADFLRLCKALDRDLFRIGDETFKDAIKGVCKFKDGARSGSYYADLLPQLGVSASPLEPVTR